MDEGLGLAQIGVHLVCSIAVIFMLFMIMIQEEGNGTKRLN